jgi:hypothetical protein
MVAERTSLHTANRYEPLRLGMQLELRHITLPPKGPGTPTRQTASSTPRLGLRACWTSATELIQVRNGMLVRNAVRSGFLDLIDVRPNNVLEFVLRQALAGTPHECVAIERMDEAG